MNSTNPYRVVIVAHPDDEVLWFSAWLASAQKVVLCFGAPYGKPEKAAARERAVSELDLPGLAYLAIPEAGVHRLVDWVNPRLSQTGMMITEPAARFRYDENFVELLERLRPLLGNATDVYTHNAWGEYGHPEHVQVHRAVAALQKEIGFTIWTPNYVGPNSLGLAGIIGSSPCWDRKIEVRPDVALAKVLRASYVRNGAWTWSKHHRWPRTETFYAQSYGMETVRKTLVGETLLDVKALRWWYFPHFAVRRVTGQAALVEES